MHRPGTQRGGPSHLSLPAPMEPAWLSFTGARNLAMQAVSTPPALLTPPISALLSSSTQALKNIAKTWESTTLDVAPYKDKGHHRIR